MGEGYASSFYELMENTICDNYGTGKNPKCTNCMVHCGYEATAVDDTFRSPLKAFKVFLKGPKTEGEMAPELPVLYDDDVEMKPTLVRENKENRSCGKNKQVA